MRIDCNAFHPGQLQIIEFDTGTVCRRKTDSEYRRTCQHQSASARCTDMRACVKGFNEMPTSLGPGVISR